VLADFYHNRARDYDPVLGRYIQADPIGLGGDVNPYVYAGADPVNMIDPEGLLAHGLFFGGLDLGLQLYNNGGRLDCVNWFSVGLSTVSGGILTGVISGAARIKTVGSHTHKATKLWMKSRRVLPKKRPDDQYHHWLLHQNQGIGKRTKEWLKNQPWNLKPMRPSHHRLIHKYPILSPFGAPRWAQEIGAGGIIASLGGRGSGCEC
jgi:uncharacterized protein RhaS with RHS repeats